MRFARSMLAYVSMAACTRSPERTEPAPAATGRDDIVLLRSGDEPMRAAQEHARQTLGEFQAALAQPPLDARDFQVKVGFLVGKGPSREHIWLSDVSFTDGHVSGKVVGRPEQVALRSGQLASAPRSDITDWMYVVGGVVHGAFTWRVVLGRLSPEAREKKLSELGVRLE